MTTLLLRLLVNLGTDRALPCSTKKASSVECDSKFDVEVVQSPPPSYGCENRIVLQSLPRNVWYLKLPAQHVFPARHFDLRTPRGPFKLNFREFVCFASGALRAIVLLNSHDVRQDQVHV